MKPEVTPGLSPHQDSSPRGSLFELRVAASPMCSRLWGGLALVARESRLLAAGLRPIGHGQSAAHRRISGESERPLSPSLPLSGTAAGQRDAVTGRGVAGDAGRPGGPGRPHPSRLLAGRRPQSDAAPHARSPAPGPGPSFTAHWQSESYSRQAQTVTTAALLRVCDTVTWGSNRHRFKLERNLPVKNPAIHRQPPREQC